MKRSHTNRIGKICLILIIALLVQLLPGPFETEAKAVSDFCGRIWYNIEVAEAIGQSVHIKGWAYDSDAKGTTLSMHLYCGTGADGSSDPHGGFSTNIYRSDVNSAYGLSGNHGFDITFATKETGEVRVMLYTFFADGTSQAGTPATILDKSITYRQEYTIKYNANGGSGAPANQKKINSTTLTLSSTVPTWAGHTFQGWATSATGSVAYQPGGKYTANAAATLYAIWTLNTYPVKYDANGGTDAPANQTKTYGEALTLQTDIPVWAGHTFLGWATSPEGEAIYQSGESYTGNAALNLYAVWQLDTYLVTYDANGGSGAPDSQIKNFGEDLVLSDTLPERIDYNFLGWAESADAEEPAWQPVDTYSANEALSLYAVWELARIPGDVNDDGIVNSADIGLLLEYLADLPVEIVARNADVNGDSLVNGKDALRLIKYLAGQNILLQ